MLTGNSASSVGGGASGGALSNCTLTGNSASTYGGGAYGSKLNNCIIYYNKARLNGDNYYSETLNYCCTTPLPSGGTGNFTDAPLFVNTNGWSDLRLQPSSPCLNAGNNAYAPTGTDLDGNPRIAGGTVDLGAYEFQSPASTIAYAWLQQYGLPTDGSADTSDSDRDFLNNWQEWMAGTHPTNAASVLRMESLSRNVSGIGITWSSVSGRAYTVERATNLGAAPAFSPVRSHLAGLSGSTSYTDTNAAGPGPFFYRVRVEP